MAKKGNYETPHYTTFSSFLFQKFSSAYCSYTSSMYFLPLGWETTFYMLTKFHVKLYYCVFLIFTFKVAVRKMEDSEMNGSKHSRYLICSYFIVNVFLIVCVIFFFCGRINLILKCPFIYIILCLLSYNLHHPSECKSQMLFLPSIAVDD